MDALRWRSSSAVLSRGSTREIRNDANEDTSGWLREETGEQVGLCVVGPTCRSHASAPTCRAAACTPPLPSPMRPCSRSPGRTGAAQAATAAPSGRQRSCRQRSRWHLEKNATQMAAIVTYLSSDCRARCRRRDFLDGEERRLKTSPSSCGCCCWIVAAAFAAVVRRCLAVLLPLRCFGLPRCHTLSTPHHQAFRQQAHRTTNSLGCTASPPALRGEGPLLPRRRLRPCRRHRLSPVRPPARRLGLLAARPPIG